MRGTKYTPEGSLLPFSLVKFHNILFVSFPSKRAIYAIDTEINKIFPLFYCNTLDYEFVQYIII